MSYKLMFILNALVTLAFGIGFLVMPPTVLGYFGTEARVAEQLIARFFGSALLTLGLVLWFAKDVADATIQRGMGIALFIGSLVGLVVTVIGISPASGVIRANGWQAVLLYVIFALGYGFMLFLKPRMKE